MSTLLINNDLFGECDIIKKTIELIRKNEPKEGYYLAFSGGKDSIVVKDLCIKAKVKFDAHYNNTQIDPPELLKFIREYHPDVKIHYPKMTFFEGIIKNGYPSPLRRWCCRVLKEYGGKGRFLITGIRAEESSNRSKRKIIEEGKNNDKKYLHPIFYWTEKMVWEYIKLYNLPYCKLYDIGYKRIGCIGCPLKDTKERIRDYERYPKVKKQVIKAFVELYNSKKEIYSKYANNGEELFELWLTKRKIVEDPFKNLFEF